MWKHVQLALHDSMARVVTKVATLLPGIVAFFVVLIISLLVAWGVSALVHRILRALHFDERVRRGSRSIVELSPAHAPAALAAKVVFWVLVVIGVLVGFSAFEAASAEPGLAANVFAYVPKAVGAVVLLVAGVMLARFLSRSVLVTAVNLNLQYARLLSIGVKWLLLVLTGAMVLDHLSLGGRVVDMAFGILFGGIVLALALAVGLGSRDLVSRSLEREASRPTEVPREDQKLRHF